MAFSPSSGSFSKSRFRSRFPQSKDEHRINERIRVPEVRLIDENGGQVGIVATKDALKMARDKNLDLMEVAPTARPPVCKICDYGKFKYEKKKKEKLAKKNQTVINVKEIQLRPSTEEHDLAYKFKNARTFLEEGDKVKVSMLFRGREMAHTEIGEKLLKRLMEETKDISTIESYPRLDGRKMILTLAPVVKKQPKTKKMKKTSSKEEAEETEEAGENE